MATPLATLARNLVLATPTVIGQADPIADVAPQALGDLDRGPRQSPHPADIEERLVDREPFDQWARVLEHAEHRLAGLGIGGEAGRDDDRLRAQPASLSSAHRGPHAVGLRLVTGCEHDPSAHDHGPPAQAWIVSLLHRREERIDVGMQDRPFT